MKVKIMNRAISKKKVKQLKRKLRIRSKVNGTASYPRMSFFRSNKNICVQVIDDKTGKTLASVSTYEKKFKGKKPNVETAKLLAEDFVGRLKENNIEKAVFDRNGNKFHGVLKIFVETLNEAGIKV